MNNKLEKTPKVTDFELDTADIIKKINQKKHKKASQSANISLEKQPQKSKSTNSPLEMPPQKSKGKKTYNFKVFSICVVALSVITVGAIYFQHQEISFSFLSGNSQKSSKNYLHVGPVSTTLSNNDVIRFSMNIGLEDESAGERLSDRIVTLKNQIISTITEPKTAELIKTNRYDLVKAKIQEDIERTTGETVTEVYFSELRIF